VYGPPTLVLVGTHMPISSTGFACTAARKAARFKYLHVIIETDGIRNWSYLACEIGYLVPIWQPRNRILMSIMAKVLGFGVGVIRATKSLKF
jgi:hypothetical protein